MSAQLALPFDGAPPRPRQPKVPAHAPASETSRAAAVRAIPKITAAHRHIVGVIRMAGARGATRPEICDALGMLTQTACARLNELEARGMIRKLYTLTVREPVLVRRDGCQVYMTTGRGA